MNYELDLFNQQARKRVDFPIVSAQNNSESQKVYEKNKVRFGGQRRKVFDYLMNAQELTVKKALNELNISSLPKRIEELKKQFGIKISDKWNSDSTLWNCDIHTDFKIWFMSVADKIYNQKFQ